MKVVSRKIVIFALPTLLFVLLKVTMLLEIVFFTWKGYGSVMHCQPGIKILFHQLLKGQYFKHYNGSNVFCRDCSWQYGKVCCKAHKFYWKEPITKNWYQTLKHPAYTWSKPPIKYTIDPNFTWMFPLNPPIKQLQQQPSLIPLGGATYQIIDRDNSSKALQVVYLQMKLLWCC